MLNIDYLKQRGLSILRLGPGLNSGLALRPLGDLHISDQLGRKTPIPICSSLVLELPLQGGLNGTCEEREALIRR